MSVGKRTPNLGYSNFHCGVGSHCSIIPECMRTYISIIEDVITQYPAVTKDGIGGAAICGQHGLHVIQTIWSHVTILPKCTDNYVIPETFFQGLSGGKRVG